MFRPTKNVDPPLIFTIKIVDPSQKKLLGGGEFRKVSLLCTFCLNHFKIWHILLINALIIQTKSLNLILFIVFLFFLNLAYSGVSTHNKLSQSKANYNTKLMMKSNCFFAFRDCRGYNICLPCISKI